MTKNLTFNDKSEDAWVSNPVRQERRYRRIHWAMAAPQVSHSQNFFFISRRILSTCWPTSRWCSTAPRWRRQRPRPASSLNLWWPPLTCQTTTTPAPAPTSPSLRTAPSWWRASTWWCLTSRLDRLHRQPTHHRRRPPQHLADPGISSNAPWPWTISWSTLQRV